MFKSNRNNKSTLFIVAMCSLLGAAALLVLPTAVVDAALHTCTGGVLTLTSQNLADATFDASASNCAVTITGGTADSLTFTAAVTNMVLTITNLAANSMTTAGNFLLFTDTVSGGSIDVNGITRTIASVAPGTYTIVRFVMAVTGLSHLNIKGISLPTSTNAGGNLWLHAIVFNAGVSGNGTVNSIFNVSGNAVASASSWVSSSVGGSVRLWLVLIEGTLSGFDKCDVSGNRIGGISVSSDGTNQISILLTTGSITLTGSATSMLMFRSNSARALTTNSHSGSPDLILWQGPSTTISSVSEILVDDADLRDVIVRSPLGCSSVRVVFIPTTTVTLVFAGRFAVTNSRVGGTMACGAANSIFDGFRFLYWQATTVSGVKEIVVSNNNLTIASTTLGASAHGFVAFLFASNAIAVQTIRVENNEVAATASIKANGATADVRFAFAQFGAALTNVVLLSVKNNVIASGFTATSALGAIEAYNINAINSIAGSAGGSDTLDVSGTAIQGNYTSTTGHVCVGVIKVASGQSISGIETTIAAGAVVNVIARTGAAYGGSHGAGTFMVQCGNMSLSNGSLCTANEQCSASDCRTRCCAPGKSAACLTCDNAGACAVCIGGYAPDAASGDCKRNNGEPCEVDVQCLSGDCGGTRCCGTGKAAECTSCDFAGECDACAAGFFVSAGNCVATTTTSTTTTTETSTTTTTTETSTTTSSTTTSITSSTTKETSTTSSTTTTTTEAAPPSTNTTGLSATAPSTMAPTTAAPTEAPTQSPSAAATSTPAAPTPAPTEAPTAVPPTAAPVPPTMAPPAAPAATTAATTTSATQPQQSIPPKASIAPGKPPPGLLIITLQKPKPGETTMPFDKDKFKKTLAKEIDYPAPLIEVSDPNREDKVEVSLLGANQTQVDMALTKAETLDEAQLQRLGASDIFNASAPPAADPFPLWAIILVSCVGALLIGLIVVVLKKRQDAQKQTFIHTAVSEPERSDTGAAKVPMMFEIPMMHPPAAAPAPAPALPPRHAPPEQYDDLL